MNYWSEITNLYDYFSPVAYYNSSCNPGLDQKLLNDIYSFKKTVTGNRYHYLLSDHVPKLKRVLKRVKEIVASNEQTFESLQNLTQLFEKLKCDVTDVQLGQYSEIDNTIKKIHYALDLNVFPSQAKTSEGYVEGIRLYKGEILSEEMIPVGELFSPENLIKNVRYYDRCVINDRTVLNKPFSNLKEMHLDQSVLSAIGKASMAVFGAEFSRQSVSYVLSLQMDPIYKGIMERFKNPYLNIEIGGGDCLGLEMRTPDANHMEVRQNHAFKIGLKFWQASGLKNLDVQKYLWGTKETIFSLDSSRNWQEASAKVIYRLSKFFDSLEPIEAKLHETQNTYWDYASRAAEWMGFNRY